MYTFEPFFSDPIVFAVLLADLRTFSVSAVTVPTCVVWLVITDIPELVLCAAKAY